MEPADRSVFVATGTTGSVGGSIMKNLYFIKTGRSRTFQEMWAVRLDRRTILGDCGAWVIDALTGDLYGHIVAGCATSDLAFIIPARKVFDDIETRFGARPELLRQEIGSFLEPPENRIFYPWQFTFTAKSQMICHLLKYLRPQVWSVLSSTTFRRCLGEPRIPAYPADCLYQLHNTVQDISRDHALSHHLNNFEADHRRLVVAEHEIIVESYILTYYCLSRESAYPVLLPMFLLRLCIDLSAEFTSLFPITDYPLFMWLVYDWKRPRNNLRWFKRMDPQLWKLISYLTRPASIAISGVSSDLTRTFAIPYQNPSSRAIAIDGRIKNHHARSSTTLNIPAPVSTHFENLAPPLRCIANPHSQIFEYPSTSLKPCRGLGYQRRCLNSCKKKVQDWINGDQEGRSDWVSSVAFSPDGKQVVSMSRDRTVRLWGSVTGAALPSSPDDFDQVPTYASLQRTSSLPVLAISQGNRILQQMYMSILLAGCTY
ncbi:hypothetical protein N7G274_007283 [Stereocaulon virgatum]|uniref:WD40 repeat-like protein n=1 Tax=Stereocaulon virgatum TaxID=373712 RepID=A0ABR4A356_9LECA